MGDERSDPGFNRFLNLLGKQESVRLGPSLMRIALRRGELLTEAGEPIRYVWFPHDAVVSSQSVLAGGEIVENGTIGREGFVGFSALLGSDIAIARTITQIPGEASRAPLSVILAAWEESDRFRRRFRLYVRALLVQLGQSVACNALHNVEQRLARWLLMTGDRVGCDSFAMTQEFLAEMLAVQRPTVSLAAASLQRAQLIRYARGSLTILDRAGLEAAACECYGVVRNAFAFEAMPAAGKSTPP